MDIFHKLIFMSQRYVICKIMLGIQIWKFSVLLCKHDAAFEINRERYVNRNINYIKNIILNETLVDFSQFF